MSTEYASIEIDSECVVLLLTKYKQFKVLTCVVRVDRRMKTMFMCTRAKEVSPLELFSDSIMMVVAIFKFVLDNTFFEETIERTQNSNISLRKWSSK